MKHRKLNRLGFCAWFQVITFNHSQTMKLCVIVLKALEVKNMKEPLTAKRTAGGGQNRVVFTVLTEIKALTIKVIASLAFTKF